MPIREHYRKCCMLVMPNKSSFELFELLKTVNTAINTNQSIISLFFNSWTYNKQVYNGFKISTLSLLQKSSGNIRFISFHNKFMSLCIRYFVFSSTL